MGKLSKLNLLAGLLKMMKSKKNRKNGSSKKNGQSEEKCCNCRVDEKYRDGQLKKTEHSESSESSNDEKSKQIYELNQRQLEAIVSSLKGFSELLFGRQLNKEKFIQDLREVYLDLESLPVKPELLRAGEVFFELAFDVKEEISSALNASLELQQYCCEQNLSDRIERIARNYWLIDRLLKLPVCASKCKDGKRRTLRILSSLI